MRWPIDQTHQGIYGRRFDWSHVHTRTVARQSKVVALGKMKENKTNQKATRPQIPRLHAEHILPIAAVNQKVILLMIIIAISLSRE